MMQNILLIEPKYKNKYPPLGLMKIAYFHKYVMGDYVRFTKGQLPEALSNTKWDRVYVTTLFTFEWAKTLDAIQYAKTLVESTEQIIVGGIAATLMPDLVYRETGVYPVRGLLNEPGKLGLPGDECIDQITPDYEILEDTGYREYIQNAADSIDGAIECGVLKRDDNSIDVKIVPFENKIIIEDNGVGIIAEEAEKTLISIGNSKKASDNSRGFRGIGRLAGLGYCTKLIFETSAYGENEGTRVAIDAQKLATKLSLDEKDDISAEEVLEQIYSFKKFKEKEKKHYFKVTMEGVDQESQLCVRSSVYDYLSQNVPVPYDNKNFAWGQEVKNRLKADGYIIPEYNITLTCSGETTPVVKPYSDYFSLDKSGNTIDKIKNIRSVQFVNEEGIVSAYGWIADTSYLGNIYDKRIKGLRIRKGNILIGDEQTLNVAFKDARFNGWSVGEIFVTDPKLIPNARRDNFEKTPAYFIFMEQIRNMAAGMTKEIRSASIKRNQELSQTIKTTESISKEASVIAGSEGIDQLKTASLKKRLIETKNALERVPSNDEIDAYNKEIAFEELDMLMGKMQGITAYKALNVSHGINNNEKRTLEKVFDVIVSTHPDEAEDMIDAILKVFSSDH